MTSPATYHLAALTLVAVVLFAAVSVVVLRRFRVALQRAREQFAQDDDLVFDPPLSSEASLQCVDGLVYPPCVVHTQDFDASPAGSLRGSRAKGARTL